MPSAEDYEAAAAAFEAAAQTTGTLVDPARVIMAGGVMVGGQLTDLVTNELDAAAKTLDRITAELGRLAEVCREQAELSRQSLAAEANYDAAHTVYRADLLRWQEGHNAFAAGYGRDPGPMPEAPAEPVRGFFYPGR